MIAQEPIAERLRSEGGFRHVDGVIEWAGLTDVPRALPAAFVVPDNDSASENRLNGVIDQKVGETFGVIVVVAGQAARGSKPSEELKTQTDAARDALLGWTHPETSRPTEYAGGRLIEAGGGIVAWMVRMRTGFHLRRTPE